MVTSTYSGRQHIAWLLVMAMLAATTAQAGVTARVDRNTIDLNESFLLEVVVDSDIDIEPDVSRPITTGPGNSGTFPQAISAA